MAPRLAGSRPFDSARDDPDASSPGGARLDGRRQKCPGFDVVRGPGVNIPLPRVESRGTPCGGVLSSSDSGLLGVGFRVSRTSTAVGHKVVVIGAGPAGLTAAYHIQKLSADHVPEVYEASDMVGGISRTESTTATASTSAATASSPRSTTSRRCGTRCWSDDFITVPRLSRIYYREQVLRLSAEALQRAVEHRRLRIAAHHGVSYVSGRSARAARKTPSRNGSSTASAGGSTCTSSGATREKVWGIPRARSGRTGRRSGSRTCRSSRRSGTRSPASNDTTRR